MQLNIELLTSFLGWCTVLNIGILVLGFAMLSVMHDFVGDVTGRIFGVSREEAKLGVYNAIQNYRIAMLFFNLVPYLVLKFLVAP